MACMKQSSAPFIFLFIIITLTRSTSFMFTKMLLLDLETFNILAIRFLIAFVLLFLVFFKKMIHIDKQTLIGGVAIGVAFFATMAGETLALNTLDSSTTSFVEHVAIVLVPIFESILTRKLPKLLVILCDIVTLVGVGLLTLSSGGFRWAGRAGRREKERTVSHPGAGEAHRGLRPPFPPDALQRPYGCAARRCGDKPPMPAVRQKDVLCGGLV